MTAEADPADRVEFYHGNVLLAQYRIAPSGSFALDTPPYEGPLEVTSFRFLRGGATAKTNAEPVFTVVPAGMLTGIRETLMRSLTDPPADGLGVLTRPGDDSAMLDRALRLIGDLLACVPPEEPPGAPDP